RVETAQGLNRLNAVGVEDRGHHHLPPSSPPPWRETGEGKNCCCRQNEQADCAVEGQGFCPIAFWRYEGAVDDEHASTDDRQQQPRQSDLCQGVIAPES